MSIAADLLSTVDNVASVRPTGVEPWRRRTTRARLPRLVAELAAAESANLDGGRLAIIAPEAVLPALAATVTAAVPAASAGDHPDLLDPVVILSVRQAKGLEFDSVLIADPDGILRGSARGRNDLYVALTRATHRLGVVHCGPVPPELARLHPRS
jgi:superfamily I DNA/RNA helicase